ncbi:hypothetical protein Tsp_07455 [Trichinella spiralis]|uniref:hypothetical protein n=1 Tax=Trichinella spiralis TaxID=6334 RepID=UPI0001EFCF45|nr:hypothetical protein Tsp_07455 [Trichinella spiralis]
MLINYQNMDCPYEEIFPSSETAHFVIYALRSVSRSVTEELATFELRIDRFDANSGKVGITLNSSLLKYCIGAVSFSGTSL